MAGRQAYETTRALQWIKHYKARDKKTNLIKIAAEKFGVNESTLWRAIGNANGKRR